MMETNRVAVHAYILDLVQIIHAHAILIECLRVIKQMSLFLFKNNSLFKSGISPLLAVIDIILHRYDQIDVSK